MKIVFDIGGTNMRIAKFANGELGNVVKKETPKMFEDGTALLLDLIKNTANGEEIESIAGATAGVISPEGVLEFSPNLPDWLDKDLGGFLREKVVHKVVVKNDADMAGLGEALYGAGKGKKIVAYLGIGTGVGGTRIVDGKIDAGKYGFEPGHQIVDGGKNLEEIISGGSIEKNYGTKPQDLGEDILEILTKNLAVGVYNSILYWSPDIVVLGGSLINEGDCYRVHEVAEAVKKMPKVFPELPEIVPASLGDKSGLWGATGM